MRTYNSPRKAHAARLQLIAELLGTYYRPLTFTESESLLNAFEYESSVGYPREVAMQRAMDYYFAGRRTTV